MNIKCAILNIKLSWWCVLHYSLCQLSKILRWYLGKILLHWEWKNNVFNNNCTAFDSVPRSKSTNNDNPAQILSNVHSCVSPCLEDLFRSMASGKLTNQYRNQLWLLTLAFHGCANQIDPTLFLPSPPVINVEVCAAPRGPRLLIVFASFQMVTKRNTHWSEERLPASHVWGQPDH
jgi:hypothetical protein